MWIMYCGITSGQCKSSRKYRQTLAENTLPHWQHTTHRGVHATVQISFEKINALSQLGPTSNQETFNALPISQYILENPVKVL